MNYHFKLECWSCGQWYLERLPFCINCKIPNEDRKTKPKIKTIKRVVVRLTDTQKQAFLASRSVFTDHEWELLRLWGGIGLERHSSYRAIGDKLNLPFATVRDRIKRAIKKYAKTRIPPNKRTHKKDEGIKG